MYSLCKKHSIVQTPDQKLLLLREKESHQMPEPFSLLPPSPHSQVETPFFIIASPLAL